MKAAPVARFFADHSCRAFAFVLLAASVLWGQGVETGTAQASEDRAASTASIEVDGERRNRQMDTGPEPGEDRQNRLLVPFVKHIADDQKSFWTEPTHFKITDLQWSVPFVGVTAGFIASDQWWSKQVPDSPSQMTRSLHISDYTTYSLLGLSGGAFLLGQMTNDDHQKEAGLLSGEAAINSVGLAYLFGEITQRQRPLNGNGNGNFFTSGGSFPSEHAAAAWSVASVLAHEYPGWLSQTALYGMATAVSVTRVTARQHFPSDVIVGSALGWYFGRQVYRGHHDPEVGGAGWGSIFEERFEGTRNSAHMASPYVPVDSWIYPAFERLIAIGYVQSNMIGIRPWTRLACAHLIDDADLPGAEAGRSKEAEELYDTLKQEFAPELARLDGTANLGVSVDSIYTQLTGISGTPLHDGYHFGQTLINDYGRPYGEGFNMIAGAAGQAEAGPLAIELRTEYQYAPAVSSEPFSALQAIASGDETPALPNPIPGIGRVRLLDAAVSFKVSNTQISFGQQSLWLGPGESGALLFSDNAEPLPMVRIDSDSPFRIPFLSDLLGPIRSEFFLGQLSGQIWSGTTTLYGPGLASQPWVHGSKFAFKPTPDLEIGIGLTAQFGGTGNPFTIGNFFRTFYAHRASISQNPGKRLSEFDFSYRIPGIRNWLTVYADSMVIDEYSPLLSNRPAFNPGIYLPQLPKMPKLQVRLEGATTDLNYPAHFGPGAFYWDGRYRSGYTNNGNLLGSWIGRRGRGEQAWITYSLASRSSVQLEYRNQNVDKGFLEGGHQQEIKLGASLSLRRDLEFSGSVQYENWRFPVLTSNRQSDVTTSVGLNFRPNWNLERRAGRGGNP